MAGTVTKTQIVLAWIVVIIAAVFIVAGLVWHGLSVEVINRIWNDMIDRPGGPMTFRFILQPVMAAIAALHDGVVDARTGRSPYLWTILTAPAKRSGRLREGLLSTARVILLGLGMDAFYQFVVLKTFYPAETVIIALLLAFLPYLILRGPCARLAHWWLARKSTGSEP